MKVDFFFLPRVKIPPSYYSDAATTSTTSSTEYTSRCDKFSDWERPHATTRDHSLAESVLVTV